MERQTLKHSILGMNDPTIFTRIIERENTYNEHGSSREANSSTIRLMGDLQHFVCECRCPLTL